MIELSVQLKLIIFSFIFGFFLAISVEKYNKLTINKKAVFKVFTAIILMIVYDFIYFFGIYIISNAIFHIYLILNILLGMITYEILNKTFI